MSWGAVAVLVIVVSALVAGAFWFALTSAVSDDDKDDDAS